MRKQTKRIIAVVAMLGLVLVLAGCSTSPVTSHSTGFWDRYVIYNAAQFILWLAKLFGGNSGVGIIAFTLIIRILIFPLSYISTKNMTKQSEIAPQMKALQKKYSSKDPETQEKLRDETQKLYAEAGVNPVMGCLPMLVQMPFLFALYQAIFRTQALKVGSFLWMSLGSPDPLYIMAILAAVFTGLTSWVSMMAQPVRTGMNWAMVAVMPIFIFIMRSACLVPCPSTGWSPTRSRWYKRLSFRIHSSWPVNVKQRPMRKRNVSGRCARHANAPWVTSSAT